MLVVPPDYVLTPKLYDMLLSVPRLELATSATTRPMRPSEQQGREYHFLSPDEFQRRLQQGEFLEHVEFAGHRYGTLRSEVERRLADGSNVIVRRIASIRFS